MSDLIERLRSVPKVWAGYVIHEDGIIPADGRLMHEAADEIERLRAAVQHEADCVEAYRAQVERVILECDELRRQLDPMGEYASAEELIAAMHAEKAEDDAMKQDAERYRWLRNEASTARKCDPMVCIYPLDEQDLIDGDRLDAAIDAAMEVRK